MINSSVIVLNVQHHLWKIKILVSLMPDPISHHTIQCDYVISTQYILFLSYRYNRKMTSFIVIFLLNFQKQQKMTLVSVVSPRQTFHHCHNQYRNLNTIHLQMV